MKDYSQSGEQEHILHYFNVMGIEKGHLVDLGASDGYTMSNSRALLDRGWTGDLYDGKPSGEVIEAWISLESINAITCGPVENDGKWRHWPPHFLNIDIDGNDFWILQCSLKSWCSIGGPSLIVAEINPIFGRHEWAVMPYNEAHVWNNDTYYGMSLAACEQLGKEFGYTIAYLHAGINAFLLRDDMAEKHPELVRPIDYRRKVDHRPHSPEKTWLRK